MKRIRNWIFEGIWGWLTFALLLISILIFTDRFATFGEAEYRLRLWGWWLQMIGFGTVFIGLNGLNTQFEKPNLVRRFCEYWAEMPLWRKPRNVKLSLEGATALTMTGHPALITQVDGTIEGRLAAIEEKLTFLQENLKGIDNKLSEKISEVSSKLDESTEILKTEVNTVKSSLEKAVSDGIALEVYGVTMFCIGVTEQPHLTGPV